MKASSSSSSSGAGGGVGMSRAAKKRAKGRKRKESSSSSSSSSTGRTITAAAETTVTETVTETSFSNNHNNNNTTKKKKVTSGNDDDDEKKQRRQIGTIIKTKMKKKKVEDCNDDEVGEGINSQNNDHHGNDGNEKNNNNCNDNSRVSSSLEVEGGGGGLDDLNEVETQLSSKTLTPRRILLLDDTDDDDYDGDDQGEERILRNHGNPLELKSSSEITTRYRARVLLASLLSPSGVSVNDFYDTYWGKRPLLAAYHHHHSNDSTTSNFHHDDRINSNNSSEGQKNEEKEKLVNKEEERSRTTKIDVVDEQRYHTQHTTRLNGFLTRSIINDMMSKNKLRYGLDLNVTRYADTMGGGKNAGQFGRRRITLDPPPKKRQMKEKKKSVLRSSNSNGDEDDNVNSNYDDDDVEYVIANPTDVWTNVDTASCTLRLLRPHEHNDNIHTLLSLLEVEFGCMVGSNAYLTPLHSQGFAPHYDDVDVFICQLEGYKRWRVYSPMSKRETLPRLSSRDYTEKEMNDDMELVLDVILGPGDVLYMPRGWIHQAETVSRPTSSSNALLPDKHSLHLTISAMQNWCWADYLEVLMPVALESAIVSDKSTSLREGLPRDFLHYMGTMHQMDDDEDDTTLLPEGLRQAAKAQQDRAMVAKSNQDDGDDDDKELEETRLIAHERQRQLQQQRQFKEEAKKRIMRVCKQAMSMLDDACDEIGKRFLSDRLPPALLKTEACLTKEGSNGDSSSSSSHHHDVSKKIWPNTLCRIVRPGIARLVVEDGKAVLYHCLDNSRVYHGTPLSPMEFEIDDAPALEQLLTTVEPHWIMVKDLIHGDVEDKMEIAQTLFDEGILATMLVELPDRSVKTG